MQTTVNQDPDNREPSTVERADCRCAITYVDGAPKVDHQPILCSRRDTTVRSSADQAASDGREPSPFPRLHLGDSRIVDVEQARTAAIAEYTSRNLVERKPHEYVDVLLGPSTIDPAEMLGERVSIEHVGLPSPDARAVAATVEGEPLSVLVSRIIRDVGAMSHEATVKRLLAAFADALPVPAGALDAEAWGERELWAERAPTAVGYLDYLLDALRRVACAPDVPAYAEGATETGEVTA